MTVQNEKVPANTGDEKSKKQTPDTGVTVTPTDESKERARQQADQRRKQVFPGDAPTDAPEMEEEDPDSTSASHDESGEAEKATPNDPSRVDRTNAPDRKNDSTRIRPHGNDPDKNDPTRSAKGKDEIF